MRQVVRTLTMADANQCRVVTDGTRFLVNRVPEGSSSSPVTIVLNWREELKQRVPTR